MPTVHYRWTEMLYSNPRKCQYLCNQHLHGCSYDCHTELPSEQRSQKRKRLNFMPNAFGRRLSFCSVGSLAFYASATSVLKVALYDNQKSNPVSVGCTNIGIIWDCSTAFQSNGSERSAFLLTSNLVLPGA